MIPGKYDIRLYRGDWYGWRVKLWQDAAHTVPFDLADYTVASQLRDKPGGSTYVDILCVVTAPNIIDISINASNWDDAPKGTLAAWDVEITDAFGNPFTPLAGKVDIIYDVTVKHG